MPTVMTRRLLLCSSLLLTFSHVQDAPRDRLPECRYDEVAAFHTGYDDWQRTLLDPIYKLDESYIPPDLVSVAEAGLGGNLQVRALLIEDLKALVAAAASAGTPLEVQSAYRSYPYQERTFEYWAAREGHDHALQSSARAGHSEHQLGTALDFRSALGPAPWNLSDWGKTPAGAWLAENAHRYGFVMSYPEGAQALTCYIYEPWHYRYLGREAAQALNESGLTLREWLWRQQ